MRRRDASTDARSLGAAASTRHPRRHVGDDVEGPRTGDNAGDAIALSFDGGGLVLGLQYSDQVSSDCAAWPEPCDANDDSGMVRVFKLGADWTGLGQDLLPTSPDGQPWWEHEKAFGQAVAANDFQTGIRRIVVGGQKYHCVPSMLGGNCPEDRSTNDNRINWRPGGLGYPPSDYRSTGGGGTDLGAAPRGEDGDGRSGSTERRERDSASPRRLCPYLRLRRQRQSLGRGSYDSRPGDDRRRWHGESRPRRQRR